MLKKQALLIAITYTVALLIFSLITLDIGGIETFAPSFGDKIFHFCAYALLVYLWSYTISVKYNISKNKVIIYVSVCAIIFGIIIEVLQKVLTNTRYFDVDDIVGEIKRLKKEGYKVLN